MKYLRIITILTLSIFLLTTPGWSQDAAAADFLLQGRKLMAAGQHLQAAEAYKQAIRLQPDLEPAHLGLKETYGGLGHEEGIGEANKLLRELRTDDAVGHYGLGLLYVQLRDMGYAQDEYKILQKPGPGLGPAAVSSHLSEKIIFLEN